jgi:transposase
MPLEFLITAGQISDYTPAIALLGCRQAEAVIADKGYDLDAIVEHVHTQMQAEVAIPPRSNRKQPRDYNAALYKLRNSIERWTCCREENQARKSRNLVIRGDELD